MVNQSSGIVIDLLQNNDLDALAIFDPNNLRYLSGFTGTDGVLLVLQGAKTFLTDSRYVTQAKQQLGTIEVREYRLKLEGVVDFLLSTDVTRIGFEAEFLSFAQVEQLRKHSAGKLEWLPLEKPIRKLRYRKTPEEVSQLAAAAQLAAQAFRSVLPGIQPGQTEAQVAQELEIALLRAGGEGKAFDIIVASGARGALPHGVASHKPLERDELITIDYGVRLNGYHSDETVTLGMGNISSKLRGIFDIVLSAHDQAIDQLRPGMKLSQLDAVAREYIAAKGYGEYFGHGLGHGVGLEVHEFPAVSARSEDYVEEGMVLTIEPGIYIPGLGGVRIEDTVYVTADGCRILTQLPKDFRNILN